MSNAGTRIVTSCWARTNEVEPCSQPWLCSVNVLNPTQFGACSTLETFPLWHRACTTSGTWQVITYINFIHHDNLLLPCHSRPFFIGLMVLGLPPLDP